MGRTWRLHFQVRALNNFAVLIKCHLNPVTASQPGFALLRRRRRRYWFAKFHPFIEFQVLDCLQFLK